MTAFSKTTLLLAMMLGSAVSAIANILDGRVVGIADGDTVTILVDRREVKVRIAGIDAPEKKQAFGQRSKQAMSDCAFGKNVSVDWDKTDRYGRTIGKIIANGVDCGLRQIELGMAWHYKAYAREQSQIDRDSYEDAESRARSQKTGLWIEASPLPPWEFRHPNKGFDAGSNLP